MVVTDEQAWTRLACPHCGVEFDLEGSGPPPLPENAPLESPEKVPLFGFQRKKEFAKHFEHLVSDGHLSDNDKHHLTRLAAELGLSEKDATNVHNELFMERLKPIRSRIEKTFHLTDDDIGELDALKRQYSAELELDSLMGMARTRWLLDERGQLPPPLAAVTTMLDEAESAFMTTNSTWCQLRSVRKGYAGGSVGFRVAKGVRLSFGQAVPITSEELKPLSSGTLFITDKRLLFQGDFKATSVLLGHITNLETFRDGLMVHKNRGNSDFFQMSAFHAAYSESLIRCLASTD